MPSEAVWRPHSDHNVVAKNDVAQKGYGSYCASKQHQTLDARNYRDTLELLQEM